MKGINTVHVYLGNAIFCPAKDVNYSLGANPAFECCPGCGKSLEEFRKKAKFSLPIEESDFENWPKGYCPQAN